MSSPHYLMETVYAARRGGDLLLLDVGTGDYACLPDLAAHVRLAPRSNKVSLADSALTAPLVEMGVLSPTPAPASRAPPPEPARRDLAFHRRGRVDGRAVWRMTRALGEMPGAYWRPAFPELLARARRRQAAPLREGEANEVARHALAFRELLPWVPFQEQCLFRAVLLQIYLRRAGLASTLVFGCQTWPFEAHCWVQAHDIVLDDSADHVAGFTPILAVPA